MSRISRTRKLPRTIRRWRVALGRMAWWKFIPLLFALTFVAKLLAIVPITMLTGIEDEDIPDRAEKLGWVFAVVIMPLVETLIAQVLITWIVRKIIPGSFLWPVIVSGILFGCGHLISPAYTVTMAFVGLIWAFAYLSRLQGRGFASAFWLVTFIHALNNLTAFLV